MYGYSLKAHSFVNKHKTKPPNGKANTLQCQWKNYVKMIKLMDQY